MHPFKTGKTKILLCGYAFGRGIAKARRLKTRPILEQTQKLRQSTNGVDCRRSSRVRANRARPVRIETRTWGFWDPCLGLFFFNSTNPKKKGSTTRRSLMWRRRGGRRGRGGCHWQTSPTHGPGKLLCGSWDLKFSIRKPLGFSEWNSQEVHSFCTESVTPKLLVR